MKAPFLPTVRLAEHTFARQGIRYQLNCQSEDGFYLKGVPFRYTHTRDVLGSRSEGSVDLHVTRQLCPYYGVSCRENHQEGRHGGDTSGYHYSAEGCTRDSLPRTTLVGLMLHSLKEQLLDWISS